MIGASVKSIPYLSQNYGINIQPIILLNTIRKELTKILNKKKLTKNIICLKDQILNGIMEHIY